MTGHGTGFTIEKWKSIRIERRDYEKYQRNQEIERRDYEKYQRNQEHAFQDNVFKPLLEA